MTNQKRDHDAELSAELKRYAQAVYGIRDLVVWHGAFSPAGSGYLDVAGGVTWRDREETVSCFAGWPTRDRWYQAVKQLLGDQAPLRKVRPWAEETWPGIELTWIDAQPGEMDVDGHVHVRLAYREATQWVSCMLPPTEASLRWAVERAVLKALIGQE